MSKRCPLTVKFGRDVASLIHWMVWVSNMRAVNRDYSSVITFGKSYNNELFYEERLFVGQQAYCFNGRFPQCARKTIINHNFRILDEKPEMAGTLPKNYWEIKELY